MAGKNQEQRHGAIGVVYIDGRYLVIQRASTVEAPGALPADAEVDGGHGEATSLAAAQQLLSMGYTQVANLEGGIDAWSLDVDETVPRY